MADSHRWISEATGDVVTYVVAGFLATTGWLVRRMVLLPYRRWKAERHQTSENVMDLLEAVQNLKVTLTEIKRHVSMHEKTARIFLHLSSDALYMTDKQGVNIRVSRGYVTMFDVSYEEVEGVGYERLIHEEDRERVLESFRQVRDKDLDEFHYIGFRFKHPRTGRLWYLETHAEAVTDSSGTPQFYVGVIADRTHFVNAGGAAAKSGDSHGAR